MSKRPHPWLRLGLWLLPLAWLWFTLINQLRLEWTLNPQYAYGWAVPFLCIYLLFRRLRSTPNLNLNPPPASRFRFHVSGLRSQFSAFSFQLFSISAFVICAFLYLPTRLIQEANPDWRLISWALALIVITLTLLILHFSFLATPKCYEGGSAFQRVSISERPLSSDLRPLTSGLRSPVSGLSISTFCFPLLFFLVAVPWPTFIEYPLIQVLTRANIAVTIELLNALGILAVQHGNVIEVITGLVGIDDACSGIRSFQATLMLSLFFGEFYRLSILRRFSLCLAGFALSFIFNFGRTSLLTWVAARDGVPAIAKWHDPAGITILVGCFSGLWLLSFVLRASRSALPVPAPLRPEGFVREDRAPRFALCTLPLALIVWISFVVVGVEFWYRIHEKHLLPAPAWTVSKPANGSPIKELPITDTTRFWLRHDEGMNLAWQDADGTRWQMLYFRWVPGKITLEMLNNHPPTSCLTAAGKKLRSTLGPKEFHVNGLSFSFTRYLFSDAGTPLFVFHGAIRDYPDNQPYLAEGLTVRGRLANVVAGRRNMGQRLLEIGVWGSENYDTVEAALQRQLEKLIVVEQSNGANR